MLAVLLLMVLARPDRCEVCAVRDQVAVLCPPHAAEEREVLSRETKRLRSKDEAERLAALEAIAALTRAHENAPSSRVVTTLALGLRSATPAVRSRSAELLGPPQHATEAMRVLLDALGDVDREIAKAWKEALKAIEKMNGRDVTKMNAKQLKKLAKESGDAGGLLAGMLESQATKTVLVTRLAAFRDDRVVAAIVRSEETSVSDEGAFTLLALESRGAIEAVLDHLGRWEVTPVRDSEEARQNHEKRGQVLKEGLAMLAGRRGLPVPEVSQGAHLAWSNWWREHVASFPATLPGVRSPAW